MIFFYIMTSILNDIEDLANFASRQGGKSKKKKKVKKPKKSLKQRAKDTKAKAKAKAKAAKDSVKAGAKAVFTKKGRAQSRIKKRTKVIKKQEGKLSTVMSQVKQNPLFPAVEGKVDLADYKAVRKYVKSLKKKSLLKLLKKLAKIEKKLAKLRDKQANDEEIANASFDFEIEEHEYDSELSDSDYEYEYEEYNVNLKF